MIWFLEAPSHSLSLLAGNSWLAAALPVPQPAWETFILAATPLPAPSRILPAGTCEYE